MVFNISEFDSIQAGVNLLKLGVDLDFSGDFLIIMLVLMGLDLGIAGVNLEIAGVDIVITGVDMLITEVDLITEGVIMGIDLILERIFVDFIGIDLVVSEFELVITEIDLMISGVGNGGISGIVRGLLRVLDIGVFDAYISEVDGTT